MKTITKRFSLLSEAKAYQRKMSKQGFATRLQNHLGISNPYRSVTISERNTILVEKNFEGSLVASAIIDGVRIHRVYQGYTNRYVRSDFKKYIQTL